MKHIIKTGGQDQEKEKISREKDTVLIKNTKKILEGQPQTETALLEDIIQTQKQEIIQKALKLHGNPLKDLTQKNQ